MRLVKNCYGFGRAHPKLMCKLRLPFPVHTPGWFQLFCGENFSESGGFQHVKLNSRSLAMRHEWHAFYKSSGTFGSRC